MHHYLIMLTKDFLNTNEVRGERVLLEISLTTICIVFKTCDFLFAQLLSIGFWSCTLMPCRRLS